MKNLKAQTEINSSSFNFPRVLASPQGSEGNRKKETTAGREGPLILPFTGLWRQTMASRSGTADKNAEQRNSVIRKRSCSEPRARSPWQRAGRACPPPCSSPRAASLKEGSLSSLPHLSREANGSWRDRHHGGLPPGY